MPGVFLIGFMGSGKSTVGRRLAGDLGVEFVDLDSVIEIRAGSTVAEIFASHGEAHFRALEKDALRRAVGLGDAVVALGGGAFAAPDNRRVIAAARGTTVWLDLAWNAILERLPGANEDRPMFKDAASARALFDHRLEDYERAAIRVSLGGHESAAAVAARIAQQLEEVACVI